MGCSTPRTDAPPREDTGVRRIRLCPEALVHGDVVRLGREPSRESAAALAIAYSSKRNLLASGNHEGLVQLWDPSTGREEDRIKTSAVFVVAMAFSPDGNRLATASWEDTGRIWTLGTRPDRAVWDLKLTEEAAAIAFSPDGKEVAVGGDKAISIWDASSGRRLKRWEGPLDLVRALAYSPDGKRLAWSGQFDEDVHVWDLSTGKEILRRGSGSQDVHALSFSPDGRYLAWGEVSSAQFNVHLYDGIEGRELFRMRGHQGSIQALAFAPDGKTLASGGADGLVRLWDVHTGACVLTLDLGRAKVHALVFLPGGSALATASSDGSVLVWKLPARN